MPDRAARQLEQEASGNQGARILLVEDEPIIREMIAMVLAQNGCQVEVAESGGEAVAKWEKGDFDLILMDLQMPEVNGIEAKPGSRIGSFLEVALTQIPCFSRDISEASLDGSYRHRVCFFVEIFPLPRFSSQR